jgi:hypothetical protein
LKFNKDHHPILSQQTDPDVKKSATELYEAWHGPSGITHRDGIAAYVEQLQNGKLVCVDADGKPLTGTDAENRKATVTRIIDELDLSSSTLYLWRSQRKIRLTFPKSIQDAALSAPVNLALPHVMAKWDEMLADPTGPLHGKTPAQLNKLTALEADGVVLQLKKAKRPPPTTTKSTGVARFQELIEAAFDYAKTEELDPAEELTSLFGRVFRLTDKLQVQAADIVFAMSQATTENLTKAGFETWQSVVHQLAMAEAQAKAAAMAAGAGAGTGNPFDLNASVPADAAAAKKP